MGFEQALSGLQAASQDLDVIGNNIANASTVGFKDVRAEFADVYAASVLGGSTNQIGIGVTVAAVTPEFTQGTITTTGNPLDVAINGSGFFRETQNGIVQYSRDGEFSLDANGYIVNSAGANLTGYPATATGAITATPPVPLQLSLAPVAPSATTTAALTLTLPSTSTPPTTQTIPGTTPAVVYNASTSQTVYDSQGNSHTVDYYFVENSANNWTVYASGDGTLIAGSGAGGSIGSLAFNTAGQLTTAGNAPMTVSMPVTTGATTPLTLTTTFPSTTQSDAAFSVSSNTQNGYATGQLSTFNISPTGIISGQYTNGETLNLGQIALANFTNPQGLIAQGGNSFIESAASGAPNVGAPSSGSLGSVQSGALENSTVDITTELVNLITAQRVYQANAETVKTEDQVQQTLMSLR
jgi:flagellar hook protein FlgE